MAKFDLIPLFWRYADDGVTKVLDSVDSSLQDLFLDIDTRYKALKIETCDDFKPELMRPMYLYKLVNDKGEFDYKLWEKLRTYQKDFFVDRYFIVPEEDLENTYTGRWTVTQEIRDAKTLYCGKFITEGEDFFVDDAEVSSAKNTVIFTADPFVTFSGYWKETEITTPWRKTYPCRTLMLWASDLRMSESVIDTHYADLVMDEKWQGLFRNTGAYSAFVYNFYKILYQGATVQGLCGFVNSISGYDYIKSDSETVQRFEFVYDSESVDMPLQRIIYTDKNKYVLPIDVPVAHWIKLGAVLPKFTPLTEIIKVYTYLEDPDWIFNDEYGMVKDLIIYWKKTGNFSTMNNFFDFAARSIPPRFDICRPRESEWDWEGTDYITEPFQRGLQSGEEGLWHNIVGPNFVLIDFLDQSVFDKYGDAFNYLLRELIPIHVYCSVTYRWGGWFFWDEEEYGGSGDGAWFADENYYFIEDPEGDANYSISLAAGTDIYNYGDTVTILGKAPVNTVVQITLYDAEGPEEGRYVQPLGEMTNPFIPLDDGTWSMSFIVNEAWNPRTATLKLTAVESGSDSGATSAIRIIPHTVVFDLLPYPIIFNSTAFTLTGWTDAPVVGHQVTLSWPTHPEDPSSEEITLVAATLTADPDDDTRSLFSFTGIFPAGTYDVTAVVTHGTRLESAEGEQVFVDCPAKITLDVRSGDVTLDSQAVVTGAGTTSEIQFMFDVQNVHSS